MSENDGTIVIEDIVAAAYLISKGHPLLEIIPINSNKSSFVFAKTDELQRSIVTWLELPPERRVLNNYRHLVVDSKRAQDARFGNLGVQK